MQQKLCQIKSAKKTLQHILLHCVGRLYHKNKQLAFMKMSLITFYRFTLLKYYLMKKSINTAVYKWLLWHVVMETCPVSMKKETELQT